MRLQKGKPVIRSVAKGNAMAWEEASRMKRGAQLRTESENNMGVPGEGLKGGWLDSG